MIGSISATAGSTEGVVSARLQDADKTKTTRRIKDSRRGLSMKGQSVYEEYPLQQWRDLE
jgi:hypothetical protein